MIDDSSISKEDGKEEDEEDRQFIVSILEVDDRPRKS